MDKEKELYLLINNKLIARVGSQIELNSILRNCDFLSDKISLKKTLSLLVMERKATNLKIFRDTASLSINIPLKDYLTGILYDMSLNRERVRNHIYSLHFLIEKESHPAWQVVTAYYACYYMAIDLNRLGNQFVINFNQDELNEILKYADVDASIFSNSNNNFSFKATLNNHTDDYGYINLILQYNAPKPHVSVWNFFAQNFLGKMSKQDKFSLFHIISGYSNKQKRIFFNPSEIRNLWNYQDSELYSFKGKKEGKDFPFFIKDINKSIIWSRNRQLLSYFSYEKDVKGIAFLYHMLYESYRRLSNDFFQDDFFKSK